MAYRENLYAIIMTFYLKDCNYVVVVCKIFVVCEPETKILSDKKICCISDISQYTDYPFCSVHGFFCKSKNNQQNSADEENYTVDHRF